MGCHFLLQGIFPTGELNSGLLHCRQVLYQLSYRGAGVAREKAVVRPLPHHTPGEPQGGCDLGQMTSEDPLEGSW